MTEMGTVYDFNALLKEAATGNAWPIGDYDFEVVEALATKAANSGNPMIKVKFRCIVGPYAGKIVNNNFNLTPDNGVALNIFFRHMAALGLDSQFFAALGTTGDLTPVAQALLGRRARVTLSHREWPAGSGMMTNQVAGVKPMDGLPAGGPQGGPQIPQSPAQLSVVPPPPPQGPAAPAVPQYAPPAAAPVAPPAAAQPTTTYVPPPAPQMPPATPPAPATQYVPPAPPTTQIPATPPAPQAPQAPPQVPPQASNGWLPPGFTQELWDQMPQASKDAIIQSQAAPPPPPGLPV